MENKRISLRIVGYPNDSNVCKLLEVNNPGFRVDGQEYNGFGKDICPCFFTVSINSEETVYALIKNNIRSKDFGCRTLRVSISIPKDDKLAGGCSPLDVLKDLWKVSEKKYLKETDVTNHTYEYLSSEFKQADFDEILNEYPLEQQEVKSWHQMALGGPVGCVVAEEEKIRELLRDVQDPEFSRFSTIVIADSIGETECEKLDIEIPRKLDTDDVEIASTTVSEPVAEKTQTPEPVGKPMSCRDEWKILQRG